MATVMPPAPARFRKRRRLARNDCAVSPKCSSSSSGRSVRMESRWRSSTSWAIRRSSVALMARSGWLGNGDRSLHVVVDVAEVRVGARFVEGLLERAAASGDVAGVERAVVGGHRVGERVVVGPRDRRPASTSMASGRNRNPSMATPLDGPPSRAVVTPVGAGCRRPRTPRTAARRSAGGLLLAHRPFGAQPRRMANVRDEEVSVRRPIRLAVSAGAPSARLEPLVRRRT